MSEHQQAQAASKSRSITKTGWAVVDGAMDGLPWFVVLAGGVVLGVVVAQKLSK